MSPGGFLITVYNCTVVFRTCGTPAIHDWLSVTTPVTGSHSACSYNFCPGAQDVFISWVQHLTQTMAKVSLGTFSLGVSAINMLGKIENEAHKNVKVNTDEF